MIRHLRPALILLALAALAVLALTPRTVPPEPEEGWEEKQARYEARYIGFRQGLRENPVRALRQAIDENGSRYGLRPEDLPPLEPSQRAELAAAAARRADPDPQVWDQAAVEVLDLLGPDPATTAALLDEAARSDRARRTWILSRLPADHPRVARMWSQDLEALGLQAPQRSTTYTLDGDLTALSRAGLGDLELLQLAERHPDSRFTRAAREFARIRGGTYFGDLRIDRLGSEWEDTPQARQARERLRQGLHEESEAWAAWRARNPDHPGADDAAWWRMRTLEWQGRRGEALETAARALVEQPGDGDLQGRLHDAFLRLLDVGTTEAELRDAEIPPLLQPAREHALAVRAARRDDYAAALRNAPNPDALDLVLALASRNEQPRPLGTTTKRLEQQRERWLEMQDMDRMQRAEALLRHDGWISDYLVLHDGDRIARLAWSYRDDADRPGDLPDLRLDRETVRQLWEQGSSKAHAWRLVRAELDDPRGRHEEARARGAEALARQWTMHDALETAWMHPLPSHGAVEGDAETWYREQTEHLVRELLAAAPGSPWRQPALDSLARLGEQDLDQRYPPTLGWRMMRRLGAR